MARPKGSSTADTGHPRVRHPIRWTIYMGTVLVLHVLFAACFGYRRFGTQRVPRRGPLLVVSNHTSYLDSIVVGCALHPRLPTHLARAGLFRFRPFGALIRVYSAVPIKDEEGDLGAIRAVIERLKLGDAVIIYPEGSRTTDGEMRAFKRGATLIAKKSGCTVLPVAVDGAFEAWPRSRKLPRLWGNHVRVLIGTPIGAGDLLRDGNDAGLARLEREVRALRARLLRTRPPTARTGAAKRTPRTSSVNAA